MRINNINNCLFLKRNIECLVQWCEDNRLQLNIDKCCILTLDRSKYSIAFDYNISGKILGRCTSARILGVTFDSKLTFLHTLTV